MSGSLFQPFAIEQYMSENEHAVKYHFAESGVHPLTYAELFELASIDTDSLFATLVDYPQVNGIQSLREKIATMYDGTTAENIPCHDRCQRSQYTGGGYDVKSGRQHGSLSTYLRAA
jgi:hypothetical protein